MTKLCLTRLKLVFIKSVLDKSCENRKLCSCSLNAFFFFWIGEHLKGTPFPLGEGEVRDRMS